jgi:hypothetical protein
MRCFARGRMLSESLGVDTAVQIEELKTKRFQFVKASSALPHCLCRDTNTTPTAAGVCGGAMRCAWSDQALKRATVVRWRCDECLPPVLA